MRGKILHIWGTITHKFLVFTYISGFCVRLLYRGLKHDLSKFSKVEMEGFSKHIGQLKYVPYGSKSYEKMTKIELEETIKHHYKHNSHHPENHKHGILDFDLYDLVEMFYDWKASTKRHKDGDMEKSIRFNQNRFKLNDDIVMIYFNTNKKVDKKENNRIDNFAG